MESPRAKLSCELTESSIMFPQLAAASGMTRIAASDNVALFIFFSSVFVTSGPQRPTSFTTRKPQALTVFVKVVAPRPIRQKIVFLRQRRTLPTPGGDCPTRLQTHPIANNEQIDV